MTEKEAGPEAETPDATAVADPAAAAGPTPTGGVVEPVAPAASTLIAELVESGGLAAVVSEEVRGALVLHPTIGQYIDTMEALRDSGFEMCADLCGVDYLRHLDRHLPPGITPERFEVVVNVVSVTLANRIRVRVQVSEALLVMPTLVHLYPGADAMEREVFDMFGVRFEGHPDLTRILMPEEWEGHPLRKDYSTGRVPVQFKEAPGPR